MRYYLCVHYESDIMAEIDNTQLNNIKVSSKKLEVKRNAKGHYQGSGNPKGRTKGSKNRYTAVKEDIMWAFKSAGGKYRLRDILAKGNANQFLGALSQIVKTLPKDTPDILINNNTVYVWKGDKKEELVERSGDRL